MFTEGKSSCKIYFALPHISLHCQLCAKLWKTQFFALSRNVTSLCAKRTGKKVVKTNTNLSAVNVSCVECWKVFLKIAKLPFCVSENKIAHLIEVLISFQWFIMDSNSNHCKNIKIEILITVSKNLHFTQSENTTSNFINYHVSPVSDMITF